MTRRVVVTGLGVVSPAGVGLQSLSEALRRGRSLAVGLPELESLPGEPRFGAPARGFEPRDFLERRHVQGLTRSGQLFAAAALMAVRESGVRRARFDSGRVGVFEGSSLGGMERALEEHSAWLARGARAIHPRAATAAMLGAGSSAVASLAGFRGPLIACSNGSVSAACAVIVAADQIRLGEIDVAVVGGGEAPLNGPVLALLGRAGLLSRRDDDPAGACRPFDATRDGTVLGEAGAALVLESLVHAEKRGARILAELRGAALTNDAAHATTPEPAGRERALAMKHALAKAGVVPSDVDYVSAHGTATLANDASETRAIKRALGPHAYRVPISAAKSILGHALGAAAALELVATLAAMRGGFIPPTANLSVPDPECDLDYVPGAARAADIQLALVNSCSFGGRNASLLLQRWDSGVAAPRVVERGSGSQRRPSRS